MSPYPKNLDTNPNPHFSLHEQNGSQVDSRFAFASQSTPLKIILWSSFALFCLVFFTVLKLPEDRIKFIVESHLNSALGQKGISMTSETGKLSLLFGVKYTFKGVLLKLPVDGLAPTRFSRIEVSPSLSRLWMGQMGGKLKLADTPDTQPSAKSDTKKEVRTLEASFSQRKTQLFLSFQAKKFLLEKIGFFPLLFGIQGSTQLDGQGKLEGDWTHFSSLTGNFKIHLSQLVLDAQTIEGFNLPKITISSSDVSLVFKQGKGTIQELRLGNPLAANPPEDLQGTFTGSLSLMDKLEASLLDLKTSFSISENVMKSFVLLDALLGAGKQPNGTYAFGLTGPIESINAQPISATPTTSPGAGP